MGAVAFASGGRVCAFAEDDGRQLWCAGRGTSPVYSNGEIAFAATSGAAVGIGLRSGRTLWRRPDAHVISSVPGGFFAVRGESGTDASTVFELSPGGTTVWSTRLRGFQAPPTIAAPYAFVRTISSGATLSASEHLVRLGAAGGLVATVDFAWGVVDVTPPTAVLVGSRNEEVEDHFLTFDIWIADLRSGAVRARYHYEPDHDENSAALSRLIPPGDTNDGKIAVDAGMLYMAIGPELYRYRLAPASGQRPLRISSSGRFVGGPYRGALYVARRDGVWALRPGAAAVRAQLVAPSAAAMTAFTIANDIAYAAFEDGHIRGVDTRTGQTLLDARTCPGPSIGVGRTRIFVACSLERGWRIDAFPVRKAS